MSSHQILIKKGYLGKDPELKYLPSSGTAVCNFSLAVQEWKPGKDGEKGENETIWFKISAFGKIAETLSQHYHKGDEMIGLTGTLRYDPVTGGPRLWEGNDGIRASYEMTLDSLPPFPKSLKQTKQESNDDLYSGTL